MTLRYVGPAMLASALVLCLACGGGGGGSSAVGAAPAGMVVQPSSAVVGTGTQLTFAAEIDGAPTAAVVWSVAEPGGGTIDSRGTYTAPQVTGTFHVTARSAAGSVPDSSATVAVVSSPPGLASCGLVDDTVRRSAAPLTMPAYRASTVDPVFGARITRITGNPGTAIPNVKAGNWQSVAGPGYAKDQAWSADGALLVLRTGAANGMLFLDGNDYRVLAYRSSAANLRTTNRWHPTRAGTMIFVDRESGRAGWWEPIPDTVTIKFDPGPGYTNATLGKDEGNPSNDGDMLVIAATRAADGAEVFFAANLANGAKYPDVLVSDPRLKFNQLDWASISPLGKYIVASQNSRKQAVVTLDGSSVLARWTDMGHYDLGVDTGGNEVAYNAKGYMVKLSDGSRSELASTGTTDYHSSTRSVAAATWGFASLMGRGSGLDGEIVAQELGPPRRLRRIVHHRGTGGSGPGGYPHSTFAVPSPDGKRVLFRSDWGKASGPVYGFVADVRELCR